MLEAKRADLDATFASQLASTDATLQKLAAAGQLDEAVAVATAATGDMGAALLKAWGSFFGELFVRFRDGYDIAVVPDDPECGCSVASDVYRGSWCVRQAHLPRLSHSPHLPTLAHTRHTCPRLPTLAHACHACPHLPHLPR